MKKYFLGVTYWAINHTLYVGINPDAARDAFIYKSVLAHELCHVEDFLNNIFPRWLDNEKPDIEDEESEPNWSKNDDDDDGSGTEEVDIDGHGPKWLQIANRINGIYGNNFITIYTGDRFKYSLVGNIKTGKLYIPKEPVTEAVDNQINDDGWILPSGKFIPLNFRLSNHLMILRDHGMDSYKEAYKEGWIHLYILNRTTVELDTTTVGTENSKKLMNVVRTRLAQKYPSIILSIWGESGFKKKTLEWNGRYFDTYRRRDESINEGISVQQVGQDGWLLPTGKFIPNAPGEGHWNTLKKAGIKTYTSAWRKGWLHVSCQGRGECVIQTILPYERVCKRSEKIATDIQSSFPNIFLLCGESFGNDEYEWTGKEFVRNAKRRNMYESYGSPATKARHSFFVHTASSLISRDDVAKHLASLWHHSVTPEQVNHLLQADWYELKKVPLDLIRAEEGCFSEEQAKEYGSRLTPLPPVILQPRDYWDDDSPIVDGHHRAYAAYLRGDKDIMAYVPVEDSLIPPRGGRFAANHIFESYDTPATKASGVAFIKRNGSKTSPIDDDGWLLPNGTFVPNGITRGHVTTALKMGFKYGYDAAYEAGLIRLSIYIHQFETSQQMSPRLENLVIKAIKRMRSSQDATLISGSGSPFYKRFNWDGKQLVSQNRRAW
jgi:hypothetical protein